MAYEKSKNFSKRRKWVLTQLRHSLATDHLISVYLSNLILSAGIIIHISQRYCEDQQEHIQSASPIPQLQCPLYCISVIAVGPLEILCVSPTDPRESWLPGALSRQGGSRKTQKISMRTFHKPSQLQPPNSPRVQREITQTNEIKTRKQSSALLLNPSLERVRYYTLVLIRKLDCAPLHPCSPPRPILNRDGLLGKTIVL